MARLVCYLLILLIGLVGVLIRGIWIDDTRGSLVDLNDYRIVPQLYRNGVWVDVPADPPAILSPADTRLRCDVRKKAP